MKYSVPLVKRPGCCKLSVAILTLALSGPGYASDPFSSMYGAQEFISIATGTKKSTREAPAVVTVIDREQIENSSAQTLEEVLEKVAGIHISYAQAGYTPVYSIRGISGDFNQQALTMINDVPMTHIHNGDQGIRWSHMPSSVIEKIEIVRGPGSVLYGADAYAGVINIITRNSKDQPDQIALSHGTFDTTSISSVNSFDVNEWEVGVTFEAGTTNGFDKIVESDLQSFLDSVSPSDASRAPGPVNAGKKWVDLWAQARKDSWIFDFGYQGRYDNEMVIGWNGSLDEQGLEHNDQFMLSGKYKKDLEEGASFEQHFSMFYSQFVSDGIFVFPEGNAIYPNGLYSEIGLKEIIGRYNIAYNFKAGDRHTFRLGIDTSVGRLFDIYENKNFDAALQATPDNSLISLTDDDPEIFLRAANRRNIGVYAQDEMSISDDTTLTLGLRFDRYNDFGNTFNPRIAWVRQFSDKVTAKVLYGTAFLAPSIFQLFAINNPVRLGNPNLKPDSIKTLEGSLIFQLKQDEVLSFNIYQNQRDDIIELVNGVYQNFGIQKGVGLEIDYKNYITNRWTLRANMAFTRSTDDRTDEQTANTPQRQLFINNFLRATPEIYFGLESFYIGNRARNADDARSESPSTILFNVVGLYEPIAYPVKFKFGVRNLFDRHLVEPSTFSGAAIGVPGYFPENDLPLAGRNLYGELQYVF